MYRFARRPGDDGRVPAEIFSLWPHHRAAADRVRRVAYNPVAFDPPFWVHLITSVPFMAAGTLTKPLRPIKGWLVASQFVNRAQTRTAGTGWR